MKRESPTSANSPDRGQTTISADEHFLKGFRKPDMSTAMPRRSVVTFDKLSTAENSAKRPPTNGSHCGASIPPPGATLGIIRRTRPALHRNDCGLNREIARHQVISLIYTSDQKCRSGALATLRGNRQAGQTARRRRVRGDGRRLAGAPDRCPRIPRHGHPESLGQPGRIPAIDRHTPKRIDGKLDHRRWLPTEFRQRSSFRTVSTLGRSRWSALEKRRSTTPFPSTTTIMDNASPCHRLDGGKRGSSRSRAPMIFDSGSDSNVNAMALLPANFVITGSGSLVIAATP